MQQNRQRRMFLSSIRNTAATKMKRRHLKMKQKQYKQGEYATLYPKMYRLVSRIDKLAQAYGDKLRINVAKWANTSVMGMHGAGEKSLSDIPTPMIGDMNIDVNNSVIDDMNGDVDNLLRSGMPSTLMHILSTHLQLVRDIACVRLHDAVVISCAQAATDYRNQILVGLALLASQVHIYTYI